MHSLKITWPSDDQVLIIHAPLSHTRRRSIVQMAGFKTGRYGQDIPLLLRHNSVDARKEQMDYIEAREQD